MDWTLFKISTAICCWFLLWVYKLTDPEEGLFDFAPNYYPFKKVRKIQLLLRCAPCLSGWTAAFFFFFFLHELPSLQRAVYAFGGFCFTAVWCVFIDQLTFSKKR